MDSMYELLMGLPLFKGVSYKRISDIIERTKFHFLKYTAGETIVEAGSECTHLKFVISGSVRVSISNADSRFKVSQTLDAPDVIVPEYLFGRATKYPCHAVAIDSAGILQIEKQEWVKILNSDSVFLFNFMNLLSSNAQKAVDGVLALTTGSLEERIAFWIVALTQRNGRDIVLSCRQRDLYALFGVQRSSFVATLEGMKKRGLIDYDTHEIRIVSRDDIVDLLTRTSE